METSAASIILCCLVLIAGCGRNVATDHRKDLKQDQRDPPSFASPEHEAQVDEPGQVVPDKVVNGIRMVPIEPPHQVESRRKLLFAVPLDPEADKDRLDLWNELAVFKAENSSDRPYGLTDAQYRLAGEYLDKYRDAEPLEKLVFWHMFSVRFAYQNPSGSVGGLGSNREAHLTMEKKMALLYSALGEDPESLPSGEASDRAMEILRDAARSNGWKE